MKRKTKFDEHGRKVRSIYSPGFEGTRIPDGKPGVQHSLLAGESLAWHERVASVQRPWHLGEPPWHHNNWTKRPLELGGAFSKPPTEESEYQSW